MRRAAALALVLAAAGCGSPQPKPARQPHLPRALAQSWRAQADAVAAALAAGDGCTAQQRAAALQSSVLDAVNARRVPPRFQEPLVSGVNDLVSRIVCVPPAPPPAHGPPHGPPPHGHDKHGHGHPKGKD